MAVELRQTKVARLEKLFPGVERATVEELLANECADNLPTCGKSTPESLDRIRFAVLKLSAGNSTKLLDSIRFAQVDWRDLLMAAGFGGEVRAHEAWRP